MHLKLKLIDAGILGDRGAERLPCQAAMCLSKCLQPMRRLPLDVQHRRGHPGGRWDVVEVEVCAVMIQPQVGGAAIESGEVVLGRLDVGVVVLVEMRLALLLVRRLKQRRALIGEAWGRWRSLLLLVDRWGSQRRRRGWRW